MKDSEPVRCPECGLFYKPEAGRGMCAGCSALFAHQTVLIGHAMARMNLCTPEAIASFLCIPVRRVRRIMETGPFFPARIQTSRHCLRCGTEVALDAKAYCVACLLELAHLDDALSVAPEVLSPHTPCPPLP
ncbi:MAG TPA: hypothetical protein PLO62_02395 [Candidatus Hydrogenedentes bacterium]|nr:hypothetical protein [Candidatus Hydrogenedentota bacterium]